MTTPKTYRLEKITDLFEVPPERRADCLRDIEYGVALCELAGVSTQSPWLWTDDGDKSPSLHDENGDVFLKLEITKVAQ